MIVLEKRLSPSVRRCSTDVGERSPDRSNLSPCHSRCANSACYCLRAHVGTTEYRKRARGSAARASRGDAEEAHDECRRRGWGFSRPNARAHARGSVGIYDPRLHGAAGEGGDVTEQFRFQEGGTSKRVGTLGSSESHCHLHAFAAVLTDLPFSLPRRRFGSV